MTIASQNVRYRPKADSVLLPWRRPFGTTRVQPSGKGKCQANYGNQRHDDGNDKECDSIEERGKPEGRVPLPQSRARAVKRLRRRREGQIIGLLGGEFTEAIEGACGPVDFAHCFEQQVLQGRVKILSHEHPVAGSKQVNVRIGEVTAQVEETSP